MAAVAARMIAEDGITDMGLAKLKAVRQLGNNYRDALPARHEVEAALSAHLALYQAEESQNRLRQMRAIALEFMALTAEFHPYLTGAALDGVVGRYATIDLDLFADSSKHVEIMLLSHGITYATEDMQRKTDRPGVGAETLLKLERSGYLLRLVVYPDGLEREMAHEIKTTLGNALGPEARLKRATAAQVAMLLAGQNCA